jgi:DUF4097 and DUF4098 domain-containing protein YvlB
MFVTLAAFAGLALGIQQTDTTVSISAGTRLRVDNFAGEVVIRAGAEGRLRVRANHASRDRVELIRGASTLTVKAEGRRGVPQSVDFDLAVPPSVAITVSGVYTDVRIEGTTGNVTVETVQGEVAVTGGGGFLKLQSVEGEVVVRGARGRVEATSVNEGVNLRDVVGDVKAETVNGDIALLGIDAAAVLATTVNGDITYDGTIKNDGRYGLSTHNGDITVALDPDRTHVTVTVSTFSGEFESSFPVRVQQLSSKHRFTFVLGNGTGRLELESFAGDIRLRRPAEMRGRSGGPSRDRDREDEREKRDHKRHSEEDR